MRKLLAILAVFVLGWLGAPIAAACSCVELSLEEQVEQADIIAHVRVVEVNADDEAMHIFTDVMRTWKGELPPQIHVVSAVGESACGITRPEEGSQLLVFGRDNNLSYLVDLCSGTTAYTSEDQVSGLTELLGRPTMHRAGIEPDRDVREEPEEIGFSWWITGLSTAALLVIGIFVYYYERKHREQRRR